VVAAVVVDGLAWVTGAPLAYIRNEKLKPSE
jgi:hypothetical protein